jgi:hypothetical protein
MRNEKHIREVIHLIRQTEGETFECNEEIIVEAYYRRDLNAPSVIIKILSIVGGLLVTSAILLLLFLAELLQSAAGMLIFGAGFIAVAIGSNRKYSGSLLSDALSVPVFASGFFLIGFACIEFGWNKSSLCLIFILMALGSLFLIQTYLLSFISVCILVGSCLSLFLINDAYDWIFIYNSILAGIVSLLFWKEAQWITKNPKLALLYNPVRSGLVISFLAGLVLTGIRGIIPFDPVWIWLSSVVPAGVILYLISRLLRLFQVKSIWNQSLIYTIAFLLLGVTAFSPALSGTILIILLGFQANYKSGFYLGILSFIYFIIQYYYDLHFTLLVKSGLLCLSGILFIVLYLLFTYSKQKADEQI